MSNFQLHALACDIDLSGVLNEPKSNDLWLAARAAEVFDVSKDSVHLNVLKFINSVYVPVSVHFIEFS